MWDSEYRSGRRLVDRPSSIGSADQICAWQPLYRALKPTVSVGLGLAALTRTRRSLSITHSSLRLVKIFTEKVTAIAAGTETAPYFT